jgi:hypothetical protein
MTIDHGGFYVLTTAWAILVLCIIGGIILVKKKGKR